MSLAAGSRLGPYEILGSLGAGGMGEVYRARDPKLHRDVALKILPEAFARDADRRARFEREAHVLASLSHANIGAIYGLEDANGVSALVLELIEGPTLAEHLANGPIPWAEAWPIARQIAEALEAAHEIGIVHRDLKPANIKLKPDGTVKVLDFGLARALGDGPAAPAAAESPPINAPALTRIGVILGTAAYMSPEQARGQEADKRSDVWSFGCLLYEMLAGRRAFEATDVPDTMAAVLRSEPEWDALPTVPDAVRAVLRRCLEKDRRQRLRDIGDARLELDPASSVAKAIGRASPSRPTSQRLVWTVAAGAVLGTAGIAWAFLELRPRESAVDTVVSAVAPLSAEITLDAAAPLALNSEAANVGFDSTLIDISPDSRRLVYVGISSGTSRLYARELGGFEVRPLPGTEGAIHPFFSADGESIGFLTNDKLKAYSLVTGSTTTIADSPTGVHATWMKDGRIFFAVNEGRRLVRVDARGGTPVTVAEPRQDLRYGRMLPDGIHVVTMALRAGISADYAELALLNLETGAMVPLGLKGYDARVIPPGYLVFGRSGAAFAVRFDLERLEVSGAPAPVVPRFWTNSLYPHMQLAVSSTGLLAHAPGVDIGTARVAWVDRSGQVEYLPLAERVYGMFDLSDDGRRLAIHVADNRDYVLIYDIARGAERRLPATQSAGWPKWSPSGDLLAFTSFGSGSSFQLMVQRVDSDDPAVAVAESATRMTASTWSADGRQLTFYEFPGNRIGVVSFDADGSPAPPEYLSFPGDTHDVSPDSRWIAYSFEGINVRPLPPDGRVYKIADAGAEPRWCRKCNEVMYRQGSRWFTVPVRLGNGFEWEPPRFVLQTQFNDTPGSSWFLSPDGQRILVLKRPEEEPLTRLNVLQGWLAALTAAR